VIVVASVSCIYGLGSPDEYRDRIVALRVGEEHDQRDLLRKVVELQYDRNDMNLVRGTFRARGDTVEIHPAYEESAVRLEFFGDTLDRIVPFDVLTGEMGDELEEIVVFANTHYVAGDKTIQRAIGSIEVELRERLAQLQSEGKLLEAQRLRVRTQHDLEMLAETGVCSGIENYSRHLDGRAPGQTPYTLLDFFPKDYVTVIDESHVAVPQLHGQHAGDRSRKDVLVEHGFRLPSAVDNRPLRFDEFVDRTPQTVFVSATPGPYELEVSTQVVDPEVVMCPTKGQVDDLMTRIEDNVARGGRVLVTTLTKKMAEDLSDYLADAGIRVQYLHSDIDTITRIEILRSLRLGEIDVLVGINLLREGLDLPEVSLVAILDADKEGFLRSASSLIQTMGRAARNVDGSVVLYADTITDSMREAVSVTQRRRERQIAFNAEHGIDPQTIRKAVTDILERLRGSGDGSSRAKRSRAEVRSRQGTRALRVRAGLAEPRASGEVVGPPELVKIMNEVEAEMRRAAAELRFEEAALLRDELSDLRSTAEAS
jgi:excinuclease ABC subunit B